MIVAEIVKVRWEQFLAAESNQLEYRLGNSKRHSYIFNFKLMYCF